MQRRDHSIFCSFFCCCNLWCKQVIPLCQDIDIQDLDKDPKNGKVLRLEAVWSRSTRRIRRRFFQLFWVALNMDNFLEKFILKSELGCLHAFYMHFMRFSSRGAPVAPRFHRDVVPCRKFPALPVAPALRAAAQLASPFPQSLRKKNR